VRVQCMSVVVQCMSVVVQCMSVGVQCMSVEVQCVSSICDLSLAQLLQSPVHTSDQLGEH
jgi:hypothetical protein